MRHRVVRHGIGRHGIERRPGALALWVLLWAGSLNGGAAVAQEADPDPTWTGGLHYTALQVAPTPDAAFWHTFTGSLRRWLPGGSIAVEASGSSRFEIADGALALDGYADLYTSAYAHVRAQVAPEALALPRVAVLAELFQGVGPVELQPSLSHQRFEDVRVTTAAMGFGWYAGRWYLRQQTLAARIGDTWSPFARVSGRRYLGGGSDSYLEVSTGGGSEVLEAASPEGAGAVTVTTSDAWFGAVSGRFAVARRLALTTAVSYSSYDRIPDRLGLAIGLLHHW